MDYVDELAFAKKLALEAGKIMREYFRTGDIGVEWKQDNTPLTVADTAINALVIKAVQKEFPEHGVLGEEDSFEPEREWIWVCDPIDGTMPFTLGIPVSAFSIALVHRSDGQAVVGVTYAPATDELFTAVRGQGAFLNEKTQLQVDQRLRGLKNVYLSIIGGTGVDPRSNGLLAGHCSDLARDKDAKAFNLYSQVYSSTKVATSDFAGSIFGYGMPWDVAAASVIVEEAGGIVTGLDGKVRRYDSPGNGCILAANQSIFDELLELVKSSQREL